MKSPRVVSLVVLIILVLGLGFFCFKTGTIKLEQLSLGTLPTDEFGELVVTQIVKEDRHDLEEGGKLFDPVKSLNELREAVAQGFVPMTRCHEEAHEIGHRAYEEMREEAYRYAEPVCGGGYLHGVMEQAFATNGLAYLETVVHDQCSGEMVESCLHGVGHGIHELTGDVDLSIATCSQVAATNTDCYDGVFMDVLDVEGTAKSPLSTGAAYALCRNAHPTAQSSCYFYLPRISADVEVIVALCSSEEVGTGWAACAQGSGVYFMKHTSGFIVAKAKESCALYQDNNLVSLCTNGVEAYEKYGAVENARWH